MVDEKIICFGNIDENSGYLRCKTLLKQSNHKLSVRIVRLLYVSNLGALLSAHSILAALVRPDLPHASKAEVR